MYCRQYTVIIGFAAILLVLTLSIANAQSAGSEAIQIIDTPYGSLHLRIRSPDGAPCNPFVRECIPGGKDGGVYFRENRDRIAYAQYMTCRDNVKRCGNLFTSLIGITDSTGLYAKDNFEWRKARLKSNRIDSHVMNELFDRPPAVLSENLLKLISDICVNNAGSMDAFHVCDYEAEMIVAWLGDDQLTEMVATVDCERNGQPVSCDIAEQYGHKVNRAAYRRSFEQFKIEIDDRMREVDRRNAEREVQEAAALAQSDADSRAHHLSLAQLNETVNGGRVNPGTAIPIVTPQPAMHERERARPNPSQAEPVPRVASTKPTTTGSAPPPNLTPLHGSGGYTRTPDANSPTSVISGSGEVHPQSAVPSTGQQRQQRQQQIALAQPTSTLPCGTTQMGSTGIVVDCTGPSRSSGAQGNQPNTTNNAPQQQPGSQGSQGHGSCDNLYSGNVNAFSGCASTFNDPNTYNWISIKNNCSQPIHVSYITKSMGLSGMDLSSGTSSNTGQTSDEATGLTMAVCPAGYNAVAATSTCGNAVPWSGGQFYCWR